MLFEYIVVISVCLEAIFYVIYIESLSSDINPLWKRAVRVWTILFIDGVQYLV